MAFTQSAWPCRASRSRSVAAGEHGGGVGHPRPPRGAVDPAGVGDGDDRAQQRLAGDAGPVGALAADQLALDDRDR